ncbi:MAG TPA: adenosylcobalamin-dependent ribonucleoside-diphosphate reductase [Spirochaetales bacterium]|nr:adenosylcobalamin-dependent ribonucleoside-diphosphate reductase [Spirochaetales bacterium]
MKIKRYYTTETSGPYFDIQWEKRVSEIRNKDGSQVFYMNGVVAPSSWSQIATDILAQKYFRKAGVPGDKARSWEAFVPEQQRALAGPSPVPGSEHDARQVFHRLAYTWMLWGKEGGYFDTDEDARAFYDELCYMLAHQIAAPNSPQWFNTGLYAVYGIEGPSQGHFYVDPETNEVVPSDSAYKRPQPHACFILTIKDDLVNEGGIMDLIEREARLFKYGSGTGSNFSTIRGSGEPLSGGGVSSGLLSFLKIGDRSANAIKSGGTTHRAAKMVILDADHPDIEEFIQWKPHEEYKVASLAAGSHQIYQFFEELAHAIHTGDFEPRKRLLVSENPNLQHACKKAIAAGIPLSFIYQTMKKLEQQDTELMALLFDTNWEGEAYNTVSGQASNNTVRVTNEFMEAVVTNKDWKLIARTNRKTTKTIKAGYLWDLIVKAAWQCADPGLQFHTTINEWHTCLADGEIRASNPCSEYMFLDDTACNLASLNLTTFYDEQTASFNIEAYRHAIRLWTDVLEISVHMAQFPSKEIARKSYDYRTLGLGYANLGTLLMISGLAYDSEEGRAFAAALSAILTGESYSESARLAQALGPFPRFSANRNDMLRVIRNHRRAAYNAPPKEYEKLSTIPHSIDSKKVHPALVKAAQQCWDEALALGEQFGFRNAQTTAIAPTGTIGLLMDCDTTGIEPDFALVKFKKLAGGGYFKIANKSVVPALRKLGYTSTQIDDIVTYLIGRGTLKDAPGISLETLKTRGFSDQALKTIEQALAGAMTLDSAIAVWNLDEATKAAIGLTDAKLAKKGFNLLEYLNFSTEEIQAAELWACGYMGIEGAPHLKPEHYAVFDTATPSGRTAKRSIPWQAHIAMMAATQPFISGAISKTINMPAAATYADVKGAFMSAWQSCLKSITIYRDGSKLSQPLSSVLNTDQDPIAKTLLELSKKSHIPQTQEAKKDSHRYGIRNPLPNKRSGYTQKAKIGGHSIFIRTGEYDDGRLGEIFLDMHKEGAAFRSLLNSFAISVSIGLQYGVPLDEYIDAFTFTRFEPNGMVQGHEYIKMATSVLDYVFRDLAINYRERYDLGQIKPDDLNATATNSKTEYKKLHNHENTTVEVSSNENDYQEELAIARMKGYEGDPCPVCGHLTLVRNGTCLKCETCGSTTGCS